jgi:hypothetical protein
LHDTFHLPPKPDRAPLHPEGDFRCDEAFAGPKAIGYRGVVPSEDGRGENPEERARLAVLFPENFVVRYS